VLKRIILGALSAPAFPVTAENALAKAGYPKAE
jgi:hypothetical protein